MLRNRRPGLVRHPSRYYPGIVRNLSGLRFYLICWPNPGFMMTKETFEAILDSFPPKPSRSRLEPYAELILELHRRGRTYREIVRILSERCELQTSRSTVNDFVRSRSRRKRSLEKSGVPESKSRTQSSASLPKTDLPPETGLAIDDIQKRIADLKRRPASTDMHSQLFQYDPDKPLSLPQKSKKS